MYLWEIPANTAISVLLSNYIRNTDRYPPNMLFFAHANFISQYSEILVVPELQMLDNTSINKYYNGQVSQLYCLELSWGRRGRDRLVVGFTTTCIISAYHH